MSDFTISVNELSKKFLIGATAAKNEDFGEYLARTFKAPFVKAGELIRGHVSAAAGLDQDFWALREVSFDVKPGEVVGLIGRNGSGKSTLLKVLTGITEPTKGYADIYGRVGSLLEVGTGFHPELTGRDNVFLSGAILGMSKAEIKSKFDEIIDFSGVEKFLDTPVKHYSSGMYVRLAFAVAAHLEPEILFIDEVLAVGDSRFQKRCLDKMDDVSKHGRTIIFVSHQMSAITRLCSRAILLQDGQIVQDGPAHKVVGSYMTAGGDIAMGYREYKESERQPGGEVARLLNVRVLNDRSEVVEVIDIRNSVSLEMEFEVITPGYILLPHFACFNESGVRLFVTVDRDETWRKKKRPKGIYKSKVLITGNFFTECTVFVNANMFTLEPDTKQFVAKDAVAFQVVDSVEGDSARGDYAGEIPGVVRPAFDWTTKYYKN